MEILAKDKAKFVVGRRFDKINNLQKAKKHIYFLWKYNYGKR